MAEDTQLIHDEMSEKIVAAAAELALREGAGEVTVRKIIRALDFFGQITDIAAGTLTLSYRLKLGMNQYVFLQDSVSAENFLWWRERIREFIDLGREKGLVRPDLDGDKISYAVWCFIRGYNTDALARGLPEEAALDGFRYSFGVLLEGMKAK